MSRGWALGSIVWPHFLFFLMCGEGVIALPPHFQAILILMLPCLPCYDGVYPSGTVGQNKQFLS